jgi:pimeloyl-ACP methyl ester carboxylesterase
MAEIANGTVARWLPGEADASPLAQRLRRMIAATPVDGFANATHALQSYDHSAALKTLTCPFLGIAGALDGAMPEAMRAQFAGLSTAQFADVPAAGHLPNLQRPAAFNAHLTAFLAPIAQTLTKETS